MKKLTITIITILFVITSFGQNKNVLYSIKDDNRSDNFNFNNYHANFPNCDITKIIIKSSKGKKIKVKEKTNVEEIIAFFEWGMILSKDTIKPNDFLIKIKTTEGLLCKMNIGKDYSYVETKDTNFFVQYLIQFNEKITDLLDVESYYKIDLEATDKIIITYKQNKDSLLTERDIKYFTGYFSDLKPISATGCPFYNSKIYFYSGDKIVEIAPAHDDCNVVKYGNNYYEMDKNKHRHFVNFMSEKVGFKSGP